MTSRAKSSGGRIRTVDDAADYLEGLINVERRGDYAQARFTLDPIRALLERVGNPQRELSIFHVAGSKGKGSTCLFAESIALCAGETVGTFTSPHLTSWTERFRVGGRETDGSALAAAVERLRPHVEALRAAGPALAPSFFDATTAAALLIFAEAGVERTILEVGLGGRLDSTNAVDPELTCITTIELEHTEKLGDTVAKIAAEKAGILKPGVPCIVGPLPEAALEVVEVLAAERGSPLIRFGREFSIEEQACDEEAASHFESERMAIYREANGESLEVPLRVLGDHQVVNAALAIAAVRRWLPNADSSLNDAIRRGTSEAKLPGRLQQLGTSPWVIVDSAHTAASALELGRVLERVPAKRRVLVLSISEGKDVGAILDALLPGADEVIATRAEPLRAVGFESLRDQIRSRRADVAVEIVEDPREALANARARLGADELLYVAGSVYLAGIALECFDSADRS